MKKRMIVVSILLLIVAVFLTSGIAFAKEEDDCVKLPVLMYHSIYGKNCGEFVVSPQILDNDLKYLVDNGYEFVSAKQLINFLDGRGTLPQKPIMITFDDGVYNNYTFAFSLLKKYNAKAIVSVVGKFTLWAEKEVDIQHSAYSSLNFSQIKEMNDSGLVEIGNHTFDMHGVSSARNATKKNKNESVETYKKVILEDFSKLQNLLLTNTGIEPYVFAYPYGKYSTEAFEILNQIGIKLAFSCEQKINIINSQTNRYLIGRFNRPMGESSATFFKKRGII